MMRYLAFLLLLGCQPGEVACPAGPIQIPAGTDLPCSDGCNSCECVDMDGEPGQSSTLIDCIDAPTPEGCVADWVVVPYGSTYDAADGCNTCTCQEDGSFSCTEASCP